MAGKTRSPNYPALGLSDAVELARKFWNVEHRTTVPPDVAAKALGFRSLSGPAKTSLGALHQYGLTDRTREGVRLSDLGLAVLHPASPDEELSALRSALTNVALFSELLERHTGASDDALRSYLITKRRFTEDGANTLIEAFRDSLTVAKLTNDDYTPEMSPTTVVAAPTGGSSFPTQRQPSAKTFSWPLSDGVVAQVTFTGVTSETVRPEYFEDLKDYLELAKKKADRES